MVSTTGFVFSSFFFLFLLCLFSSIVSLESGKLTLKLIEKLKMMMPDEIWMYWFRRAEMIDVRYYR